MCATFFSARPFRRGFQTSAQNHGVKLPKEQTDSLLLFRNTIMDTPESSKYFWTAHIKNMQKSPSGFAVYRVAPWAGGELWKILFRCSGNSSLFPCLRHCTSRLRIKLS